MPPLSTLLSLLEQASERNDEVEGGWRAPANSAIVFWRRTGSAPPFYLAVFAGASKRKK